jgi:hypothetical protein
MFERGIMPLKDPIERQAYMYHYGQRPYVKEKNRIRGRKRNSSEEGKISRKEYLQRPSVKERTKIVSKQYRDRPENKEKQRAYGKTKERKEYLREYNQRPHVKENRRTNDSIKRKDPKNKKKRHDYYEKRKGTKEYRQGRNKYAQERRKLNFRANIAERLRKDLRAILRLYGNGKTMPSSKYGIDYAKIADHLGPIPDDKHMWVIDHIRPCCSFDLTDINQVRLAFSPTNLRWLTREENLAKISEDIKQSI